MEEEGEEIDRSLFKRSDLGAAVCHMQKRKHVIFALVVVAVVWCGVHLGFIN